MTNEQLVETLKYLGSMLADDGESDTEAVHRSEERTEELEENARIRLNVTIKEEMKRLRK